MGMLMHRTYLENLAKGATKEVAPEKVEKVEKAEKVEKPKKKED